MKLLSLPGSTLALQPDRPSQETYLPIDLLIVSQTKCDESAINSSMCNFCSECMAVLKVHIHTQQRLEILSMQLFFDSVFHSSPIRAYSAVDSG